MTFPILVSDQPRQTITTEWPEEYFHGYKTALGLGDHQHEPGGYPIGFHSWDKSRKYAWFAGWNTARKFLAINSIC